MQRKVIDFLLLLFLGITSYLIILYLVGIFYTPVRPLSNPIAWEYWKAGVVMLILACVDFLIVKRLFIGGK